MGLRYTIAELAERVGGVVRGDGALVIEGVAPAGEGRPGQISFVTAARHVAQALEGAASCLLVTADADTGGVAAIVVADPRAAVARVLELYHPVAPEPAGIHPTAVVEEDAVLGRDVHIAAFAYVGSGARLGDCVSVGVGAVVGAGASVGDNSRLYARAVLYPGVTLGQRVIVHAGAVLGADGFGYVSRDGRHVKFPQVGTLAVGDDVEIGANTTIDRGALGPSTVGAGTKLDNLVQLGHNVRVGRDCLLSAQSGVGGSSVLGDGVILAGQAGLGDHVRIQDGAIVGGQGGVLPGKIVRKGQVVWGTPARPLSVFKRQSAYLANLPRLVRRVEAIARKLGLEAEPEPAPDEGEET